jgi:hypothetical protein
MSPFATPVIPRAVEGSDIGPHGYSHVPVAEKLRAARTGPTIHLQHNSPSR